MGIVSVFEHVFHVLGMRKIVLMAFVTVSVLGYLKQRHRKKAPEATDDDLEMIYKKNEEGLFPWEVDTNDSPDRVEKNAKRYNIKQYGPKRGRW